jgi:hypothetical protein
MIRLAMLVLISSMFCFCGGCATVVRGDSQKVKFQTEPPNATVNVNGNIYPAPAEVTLKRKQAYDITIAAPGYQAIKFELKSSWDGASLGDILMPGGSVMLGVDTVSGADRSFFTLTTIKLTKADNPNAPPMTMYQYRGRIVNKVEYETAMKELEAYHSRVGE